MNHLPTGTVTFLFTDIEGSTKLAQEYPDALPDLLARHNDILQQAIETHHGFVFQIVGDSFAVSFHNARDAVNAALDAQRALQNEAWSPAPIKVRMGIHTGAAELRAESSHARYVGYATLALTQRLMSAGHGGQILLSQTVHDLVQGQLAAHATLRDMGEHRLKDVLEPQHLYQLTLPDLLAEFEPLNTLDTFHSNLPTQLTSFIGRTNEIHAVKKLIQENRIVTLTGSGGCGKTRLSIQVASELQAHFPHGVWLIELAPLSDPALVPQAILSTFKLPPDSQRTNLQVLTDYIRAKGMLLVIDNCEHVIDACAQLCEQLVFACPQLKILASSREALGIAGEISYRVPSLKTPDPQHLPALDALRETEAVQLFMQRATSVKPDFALTKDNAAYVAQICARLDGIPLALELAAARVKVLSPEQIATRLDDRFRLLTGGARTALPRQQTLRALIDWSYSLLSEKEKILFRRLAVFVGGWTLDAAEQVCSAENDIPPYDVLDLLTRLVDKSLVNAEEVVGETRYSRLETIRQYSREKFFETGEVEALRNRHLAYYAQLSDAVAREIPTRTYKLWVRRMKAEEDNFRAAIEWGLDKNPESALHIVANLLLALGLGGFTGEGFLWLRELMERLVRILDAAPVPLRAQALRAMALALFSLGDNANAKNFAEQAVASYRASGDRGALALALAIQSLSLEFFGELGPAEVALQEAVALARAAQVPFVIAYALFVLARVTAKLYGDLETALRCTDESIRVSRDAGIDFTAAFAFQTKANITARSGQYDIARAEFEKALSVYQEMGMLFNLIIVKSEIAHLEREFGHYPAALEYYRETIGAFRDIGSFGAVAHQLECFGFIALAQNQAARAAQLFAAAHALRESANTPMTHDERIYYDEQLKSLRANMDAAAFELAWSKGSALPMDDAISFAVEARNDSAHPKFASS